MKTCRACGKPDLMCRVQDPVITGALCGSCRGALTGHETAGKNRHILNSLDRPVLLMQSDPRQVFAANSWAAQLFGKNEADIEGHRGGEVFDCLHSFTEAGCGKDANCEECRIRNAVIQTFVTGYALSGVSTVLPIKKGDRILRYALEVSTEKVGTLALLQIDRYERT